MEVLVCRENMFFGEKIPSAPRFFSDFGQLLFVLLPSFLPTIETHPTVLFVVVRVFVVITADFFFKANTVEFIMGKQRQDRQQQIGIIRDLIALFPPSNNSFPLQIRKSNSTRGTLSLTKF